MNPTTNLDSIDTASDPRAIFASREFDAPRDVVWRAWTDPDEVVKWWGPEGFTTTTRAIEVRPGGVWRFVMHGPDGRDYENLITFEEVVEPERLVYRHGGGKDELEPVNFAVIVTFEDLGSRTRLTMTMTFPTADQRTLVIENYGADTGLVEHLERLRVHVEAADDTGKQAVA